MSRSKVKGQGHQGQKHEKLLSHPHGQCIVRHAPSRCKQQQTIPLWPPAGDGLRRWENQRMLCSHWITISKKLDKRQQLWNSISANRRNSTQLKITGAGTQWGPVDDHMVTINTVKSCSICPAGFYFQNKWWKRIKVTIKVACVFDGLFVYK